MGVGSPVEDGYGGYVEFSGELLQLVGVEVSAVVDAADADVEEGVALFVLGLAVVQVLDSGPEYLSEQGELRVGAQVVLEGLPLAGVQEVVLETPDVEVDLVLLCVVEAVLAQQPLGADDGVAADEVVQFASPGM